MPDLGGEDRVSVDGIDGTDRRRVCGIEWNLPELYGHGRSEGRVLRPGLLGRGTHCIGDPREQLGIRVRLERLARTKAAMDIVPEL